VIWRNGDMIADHTIAGGAWTDPVSEPVTTEDWKVHYSVSGAVGSSVSPKVSCRFIQYDPLPGPASCQVTVESGRFRVAWEPVSRATEYVIYRSVEGSEFHHRGKFQASPAPDDHSEGRVVYRVESRDSHNHASAPTICN